MPVKKRPVSPRQKMINLMYILLMAMLALNVSSDVLKGFTLMSDSLKRTTEAATRENDNIYADFAKMAEKDPRAVKPWFDKAAVTKRKADELVSYIVELREAIAREADGADGDPDNLDDKETLTAAEVVMLNPLTNQGEKLRRMITDYRELILSHITDQRQRAIVASNLSTDVPQRKETVGQNWEEYMFEQMPAIAAVTMLKKLQSDVMASESEVLRTLLANANIQDIRVNDVRAFVVPEKTVYSPGETFRAGIFMAAVDTMGRPKIYVNGEEVALDGQYSFTVPSQPGEYTMKGYAIMPNIFGEMIRRDFSQRYTVGQADVKTTNNPVTNISPHVAPPLGSATLAADLMNVLYAGFDNPMSISVSGLDGSTISLSMTGGTLTSLGNNKYTARPAAVGQNCVFTVSGTHQGKTQTIGTFTFRVRKLPDPTPYVPAGGDRFKGGRLTKSAAASLGALHAAIDDGLLDIPFTVTGFQAVFHDRMGNSIVEPSAGANFTDRQRSLIRDMRRNQRFYISNVHCIGPDKIPRVLPAAMEIIVN
ncbi:MAG: gliding motility protein GldM [Bacteroidaceae bacterium]|nr:gliding motility protein GldM [Bacteroidaceae bacterium]